MSIVVRYCHIMYKKLHFLIQAKLHANKNILVYSQLKQSPEGSADCFDFDFGCCSFRDINHLRWGIKAVLFHHWSQKVLTRTLQISALVLYTVFLKRKGCKLTDYGNNGSQMIFLIRSQT